MSTTLQTLPLPSDPALARWASALNGAGYWSYILDSEWRVAFATDELRLSFGDMGDTSIIPVGRHWYGVEMLALLQSTASGALPLEGIRQAFSLQLGQYVLAASAGGRDQLRNAVAPEFKDLVDGLEPVELPPVWSMQNVSMQYSHRRVAGQTIYVRIDGDDGDLAGVAMIPKPAPGMSQLASAAAMADLSHLERMRMVERPDRRPGAVLMADLEGSSALARRLSTAQYFAFGRRLVRMEDECIIAEGGIVGAHAGDGIVAFFLAETFGSESAAARSCIAAARALRDRLSAIAARSEIPEADISLRFGLHWGATLYVGRILTQGRSEVTALGDEVNETARIEACAMGARTLASKALVERLNASDAAELGIDTLRTAYTPLAELATATEKARRDAPAIAVCEL